MASNKTSIKITGICATLLLSLTVLVNTQLHAQAQVSSNAALTQTNTPVFVDDNKASYGPIQNTDTLWKIAVAHRPDETVTNFQVMMALFASNPNAFLRNDINTLVEGQYLRIPSLEEIRTIAPYAYGDNNKTSIEIAANEIAKIETTIVTSEKIADTNKAVDEVANKEQPEISDTVITRQAESTPTDVDVASAENDTVQIQTAIALNENANIVTQTENNIAEENKELKESLTAVDDQLSYLQYEVAKASEKQNEMDGLIAEQKRLLTESKQREKRLLAQQQALVKQREGLFNNPISYWSTTGVLAILVIILFVLVYRRRNIEQRASTAQPAPKSNGLTEKKTLDSVSETASNNDKNNDVVLIETHTQPDTREASSSNNEASVTPFTAEHENTPFSTNESMVVDVDDAKTLPENEHVETAFSKIDLSDEQCDSEELLTDEDLLNNLLNEPAKDASARINDVEMEHDDELDIDKIINGMLDEETKPAKLRSAVTGNIKPKPAIQEKINITEINDYDDVEFDKLLEEISAQTNDVAIAPVSNVVKMQPAPTPVPENKTEPELALAEQDYIAIEQLIEESQEEETIVEEEIYDSEKIDVGLDEFPEFTHDVKHVDVDDDKNGVNAKLDLAQVYIEIGDLDNAAVILKTVMKLGSSSQQQKAQTLLYSLHE